MPHVQALFHGYGISPYCGYFPWPLLFRGLICCANYYIMAIKPYSMAMAFHLPYCGYYYLLALSLIVVIYLS